MHGETPKLSVASCLFMQRCCFNCRSNPHSGQNHNLHILWFIYQLYQKMINIEWVKIRMKANVAFRYFQLG